MKNPLDPRHKKRQKTVEDLFKNSFTNQRLGEDAKKVIIHLKDIDKTVISAAPEFPIDKINRIDLAILRLAVYELEILKKEPPRVIVDESIELAKEYGGDKSPAFINGALGKIINKNE